MTDFRPTVTAPSPASARRVALVAALFVLVALLASALRPDRPSVAQRDDQSPRSAERSVWDDAIASLRRGDDRPAASALSDDMPGHAPLAALTLAPHVVDGQVAGYVIAPGELPTALAEAGLRAGDVLTTIDGLPIDAARARRLADEFGGLDDIEVTYLRGGESRDTLIVFRAR